MGQKPFAYLLNTDMSLVDTDEVERYLRLCLFYGIFGSFFVDDSGYTYWSGPYPDRDRNHFKKYIPLVRTIALAGWQPRTLATTDDPSVLLERWGDADTQYLTVRNEGAEGPFSITLDPTLPGFTIATELLDGAALSFDGEVIQGTIAADTVLLIALE